MDLYGYETGFDMFSIMFFIVFALIVGTIIINAIKGISEWSNNNKQPILDINSKLFQKELVFHILTHIQILVLAVTLHIMLLLSLKVRIERNFVLMVKNMV